MPLRSPFTSPLSPFQRTPKTPKTPKTPASTSSNPRSGDSFGSAVPPPLPFDPFAALAEHLDLEPFRSFLILLGTTIKSVSEASFEQFLKNPQHAAAPQFPNTSPGMSLFANSERNAGKAGDLIPGGNQENPEAIPVTNCSMYARLPHIPQPMKLWEALRIVLKAAPRNGRALIEGMRRHCVNMWRQFELIYKVDEIELDVKPFKGWHGHGEQPFLISLKAPLRSFEELGPLAEDYPKLYEALRGQAGGSRVEQLILNESETQRILRLVAKSDGRGPPCLIAEMCICGGSILWSETDSGNPILDKRTGEYLPYNLENILVRMTKRTKFLKGMVRATGPCLTYKITFQTRNGIPTFSFTPVSFDWVNSLANTLSHLVGLQHLVERMFYGCRMDAFWVPTPTPRNAPNAQAAQGMPEVPMGEVQIRTECVVPEEGFIHTHMQRYWDQSLQHGALHNMMWWIGDMIKCAANDISIFLRAACISL